MSFSKVSQQRSDLYWRVTNDGHLTKKGQTVLKFLKDDSGGEVLEYALIAGLIVVAAIAVIGSVGGKVLASWNSLNSSM
jgi:pilus assembly protein Flp/PilA